MTNCSQVDTGIDAMNGSIRTSSHKARSHKRRRDLQAGACLAHDHGETCGAGDDLLDLEPLWAARLADFVAGGDTLTAADLRNRRTDEANHNARDVREILVEFRAARRRLLDGLAALPSDAFGRSMMHPRLKQPMRLVDHLFFAAEHDDHHLAVIAELVGQSSEFRADRRGS